MAAKIELLQNPSEKNKTVRHAIITGETGEYGGWQKNSKMQLKQRWLKLFGGYENENEGCDYQKPDFLVSSKCCYYLKEKNCDDWGKEHNSVPYLGLMASEGGRRAKSLRMNGCNYFGASTIRSAPFAIFHRQDILKLALEMDELWKAGLKEKYHEKLLKEGRLSQSFEMPERLRKSRMERFIQLRHNVPDAVCAGSESTWRNDHIGLICCMRVIRKSGII